MDKRRKNIGRNIKVNKKQKTIIIIMLSMFLGIIVGSIIANNLDVSKKDELYNFTSKLIFSIDSLEINRSSVFTDCFLKYGKFVIIIWLLAFVPIGPLVSNIIIFTRGLSYGFTTAFLFICYGIKGMYYASQMYLLQNLIMIPTYFFITYFSINYCRKISENLSVSKNNYNKNNEVIEYGVVLVIGCACVFLVSLLEAFLLPNFIGI